MWKLERGFYILTIMLDGGFIYLQQCWRVGGLEGGFYILTTMLEGGFDSQQVDANNANHEELSADVEVGGWISYIDNNVGGWIYIFTTMLEGWRAEFI
ncbi:hypothetical protein Sjap_024356 [Stephania japonica]|uniref:Uncharacterized protein n=1 Tax=Stephania japonica TaxID=461633 RepID=A0AAP0ELW8_9MAGN